VSQIQSLPAPTSVGAYSIRTISITKMKMLMAFELGILHILAAAA
jgi:hypothetical protein